MIDRARPSRLTRHDNVGDRGGKKFGITLSVFSPLLIPFFQVVKLYMQDPCLNGIQTAIVTFDIVKILLCLPVIAKHAHRLGKLVTVGGYGSGLAAGSEIF